MDSYVLIKKDVLPDSLRDVLVAKKYVEEDGYSISEACIKANISRSTYYKYSKSVFEVTERFGKQIHIIIKALNNKGVLGNVLGLIAEKGGNIISISQSAPIHDVAIINIMIDLAKVSDTPTNLTNVIRKLPYIKNVDILAIE